MLTNVRGHFLTRWAMNTGWWEIDINGCYSLVKIAFAPICGCKNNRRVWRHNVSNPRLRDATDQLPCITISGLLMKRFGYPWQLMHYSLYIYVMAEDVTYVIAKHQHRSLLLNSINISLYRLCRCSLFFFSFFVGIKIPYTHFNILYDIS